MLNLSASPGTPPCRYFLQYITQSRNTRNRLDASKELKKLVFFSNICVTPLLDDLKVGVVVDGVWGCGGGGDGGGGGGGVGCGGGGPGQGHRRGVSSSWVGSPPFVSGWEQATAASFLAAAGRPDGSQVAKVLLGAGYSRPTVSYAVVAATPASSGSGLPAWSADCRASLPLLDG